jgi:hypothetical protein
MGSEFSETTVLELALGVPSIATIFISLFLFHITTCFGLYRPSSSEIYTVVFRSYYIYNGSIFRLYNPYIYIYIYIYTHTHTHTHVRARAHAHTHTH